jgi:hypothetical protein
VPVQVTQGGGVSEPKQGRKRGTPAPAPEPSAAAQLAERAREVPMGLVQRHPGLALRLMMGAMPKRQLGEVARAADAVTSWVAQRESFAGIPGSLAAVRYTVLSRVPAERRDAALSVLDELQRLPRDQQGPLMLALQQALASGSATVPPVITQALAAHGALTPEVEAALAEAFQPSGPGTVGTAIHDWLELVPERPGAAAGQLLNAPLEVAGAAGGGLLRAFHLGGVAGAAGAAARGLETAFSKVVAGVADVLAAPVVLTKGYKWPHETPEPFGTLVDYYTNAAVANGLRSLDPEQRAVEDALAVAQRDQQAGRLLGVETNPQTGQPSLYSERMRNVMDFLAQWVVGGKIAKAAAALKTARAVPREMLPPATGVIEDTLYRIASKGVEDFVTTRRGRSLIKDVMRTTGSHPDSPVAALMERFRNMPAELAKKLAYGTADERARALVDYVKEGPTTDGLRNIKTRLAEIDSELGRTLEAVPEPGTPRLGMVEARVNRLLAERMQLEAKLGDLINREPLYQWPNASFARAVVRDVPATKLENVVAALHRGSRFRLSRLVDDLPRFPEIWMPTAASKPVDWATHNASVIGDYLRRAGTPTATIRRVMQEMLDAKTHFDAFHDWLTGTVPDAIADGLTRGRYSTVEAARAAVQRGEFRGLDLQIFDEVTRIFRKSAEEVEHSRVHVVAGTHPVTGDPIRVAEPVLWYEEGGLKRALPSQPTELVEKVTLPSVDTLTEANSLISRMKNAVPGVRHAFDAARGVLKTATTVFKPLILGPRVVAMTLRIQMEQVARMAAFGYRPSEMFISLAGRGLARTPLPFGLPMPKEMLEYLAERGRVLGEIDSTDLGMLMDYAQKGSDGEIVWKSHPEWTNGTVLPKKGEARLAAQALQEYYWEKHTDPIVRTLARVGPDRFLAELKRSDYLSFKFAEIKPQIERMGISVEEYVARKWQELQDITSGDPELIRAIGTGVWRYKGAVPEEIAGRLEVLRTDLEAGERALAEATANKESPAVLAELSRNVKELRERVAKLEEEAASYGKGVRLGDANAVRKQLAKRMSSGEWRPPPSIPYRMGMVRGGGLTGWELLDNLVRAFSDFAYLPMRFATKADLELTRGTLYWQVYERTMATLERQGWAPEFAEAAARARANVITKDIMYDLAARSSLHRALGDHSYFLPATQEVTYTWLVKIPSRYYWPVGASYLVFRGNELLDLLKATGAIRKDPYGQDMLMAPWVGWILKPAAAAGLITVPDTIFGRPQSLNLMFQGLPQLSTPDNVLLGRLARNYGGVFEAISNVLQQFGPDQSIWPAHFTYAWEFATTALDEPGPPPFAFDGGYSKVVFQRTEDQAIQAAYQEMLDEGIKPPRPEQFLTDKKDPRSGQPIADEAAYKEALQNWWDELQARAHSRLLGLLGVRLFGSTVGPFSVQATEEERLQYQRFWQSLGVTSKSQLTDAQREVLDQWLKDHPESLAYATSYYGPGDGSLPYKDFGEGQFDDKLRAGLIRVLPPEEYVRAIQTWDAYRVFINRVHNCAQKAGATPAEQLRNWAVYSACSRDARYEWERFLALNPDAWAYIKDNKERWAKLTGEKPKQTFEAERLAELQNLLKESAAYLNEAGVGYEYRAVAGALNELATYEKPTTERGKLIAWYMNDIVGAYSAKLKELYDKAEEFRLNSQDDKAAQVYDAIRRFKDSQGPVIGPDGERYPSPQVFLWNAMEPEAREQAKLAWASKPISWLSQFQRARVYRNLGAPPSKVSAFLEEIQSINRDYYEALNKLNPAPDSPQRQWMDALREKLFSRTADKYGPWARDVLKLELAPPIVRYEAIGYGMDNELWAKMVEAAKFDYEQIKRQGYNPAWYSQYAVERKAYLESVIERYRDPASPDYDRAFARLWEQLQAALPEGNRMRAWIPLYEAVLFGQFRPEPFGQENLIKAIQGG